MDGDRARAAAEIFDAALDLSSDERTEYLNEACRGDEALRAEVDSLLAHLPAARTAFERVGGPTGLLLQGELGREIGPYRLTRLIAMGGMGAVYAGERSDDAYHKKVAVKLIRPGMGTRDILVRFRRERQVLADLDHPNIARLLDGGSTPEGIPFLVMEYVDGVPIHVYCDERRAGVRDRLDLFLQVCDAVHFAHQRLVIHRDIKPSNILVDSAGRARLVDFGIAKVLDAARAGDAADATMTGMRVFTPRYASPEQLRDGSITTATDVYSLGVVLYELLAGQAPHEAQGRSPSELERAVCEDEPARPSRAPSVGDKLIAALRGATPKRLNSALAGDLDTIVLRALSKEPARRYASAEELGADIRRHLRGLPVLARPDTIRYHLSKFARRNRALVAAVVGSLLLLAGALVVTLDAYSRAREQGREAEWLAYVNALAAAEASLRGGSVAEAALRLEDAPPALRGWEWRHLRARLDRSVRAWSAHATSATDVKYSRDGTLIVTCSLDSTVALWTASTADIAGAAAPIRRWGPLASAVESVALLPDGGGAIAGLATGEVMLLPIDDGAAPTLIGRGPAWAMVDVHPGGDRVAAGFFDGSAMEWDLASGRRIKAWSPHLGLTLLAYSPDGERLITAGSDGFARLWHSRTHRLVSEFHGHAKRIYTMAVSPDGSRLATGSMDWTADVWEIASRRLLCTFQSHRATVTALAFDMTGEHLISASPDGHLIRWDAEAGQVQDEYHGHTADVSGVAVDRDGAHVVSVDWRGEARIWQIETEDVRTLRAQSDPGVITRFRDFALGSSGSALVAATATPCFAVWDTLGAARPRLEYTQRAIHSVAFTPGGDRVITGEDSGYVQIRDVRSLEAPLAVRAHAGRIVALVVDSHRGRFFTAGGDSAIRSWDIESGSALRSIDGVASSVIELSLAADRLAAARDDGTVLLFDAATLEARHVLTGHTASVLDLAFSRDGRLLASASADGSVRLWDLRTGRAVGVVRRAREGTTGRVALGAVAFSPDGARLALGSSDRIVRLYDARTLREVVALHGHTAPVARLEFDASGARLFSSSNDGTIRVWEAPSEAPPSRE